MNRSAPLAAPRPPALLRRLNRLAAGKMAALWLALISFCESIFLPLPADLFLAPMMLLHPARVWSLAALATLASVAGGLVAYALGLWLMHGAGMALIGFYQLGPQLEAFAASYQSYGGWAVFLAAFTPIPYKVAALASGALALPWTVFCAASLAGRGLRFAALALLCRIAGPPAMRRLMALETGRARLLLFLAAALASAALALWFLPG